LSLEWKYHGSTNSNTPINLPNEFNELCVVTTSTSVSDYLITIIPYILLADTERDFKQAGYFAGNGNGASTGYIATRSSLYCGNYVRNGASQITNSTTYVYYR